MLFSSPGYTDSLIERQITVILLSRDLEAGKNFNGFDW